MTFHGIKGTEEGSASDSFRLSNEISIEDHELHVRNAVVTLGQFASSIGCEVLANAPNSYVVKHI